MCDVTEASRKMRLQHEEGQKREDELWSELIQTQEAEENARKNLPRNHELLKRYEIKNKDLRARLISQEEQLEESRQSAEVTEEQLASFWKIVRKLFEELSLIKEKSSEMEKFLEENKEEKAKLVVRCDHLEAKCNIPENFLIINYSLKTLKKK